ncbi:DUF1415 domain-containing protein [Cellvibrio japonicus]|uniref:Uncharacterized protein n=1 Tax=Cellvibrio japonicus (strain Ueda107) TaxID=498211 RepID=B3PBI6_CELJU|nr:DUF1415 domain-containing protein [Cellvibrio japonicus]ACE83575.1 hypothetical protein CJA_2752 [Cellvibrio japonicus Ueda107]QEI13100.1 DUF1415 domain-containing protein [Cellvibrio japonicus]QEI16674.1 DUF1415 domain-containing protein [Cellvibrio japonicus]QEI20252.1 DUF1415 domain-containing protein [Cellvibrio japonicus]
MSSPPSQNALSDSSLVAEVTRWLNQVVIGLNLCPFAAKPTQEQRVRFVIGRAQDDEQLLDVLRAEMALLDSEPADVIETTLVIVPAYLQDFFDYNQFLGWANRLVKREGWSGVYQLASFHPDYCFAGAAPEDDTNLTNRSPYPIIHIIREASLEKALAYFPDIDQVPERNQRCVAALSEQQKRALFPYLLARD